MTKQEAKDLAIELCQYLADHPEIENESEIEDDDLRLRILNCVCMNPLCDVFYDPETGEKRCSECPLYSCSDYRSDFHIWCDATDNETRKAAAESILAKIRAWEV